MVDASTFLFVVIGNPVSHSLSPAMHNAAFHHTGYNGVYCAVRVVDIKAAMTGIRALGIQGASITIPHKIDAMAYLDEIDDLAGRIGAVNTIVNRDGRLCGYNSDGLGAVKALSEKTQIEGKDVMIIGAGGAARAVGFATGASGGKITIVNRSIDKGEKLAKELGAGFMPLSEMHAKDLSCDILINTTSVGMMPDVEASPVYEGQINRHMVIMDIVYNPLETALLKAAAARGCTIVNGVAMFVYQGAVQFEWWTGMTAPVGVMKAKVLKMLKKL